MPKNSTIAFNIADSQNTRVGNGGGIFVGTKRLELQNTIVARNVDTPHNGGLERSMLMSQGL